MMVTFAMIDELELTPSHTCATARAFPSSAEQGSGADSLMTRYKLQHLPFHPPFILLILRTRT